jgi:hypothetical protein
VGIDFVVEDGDGNETPGPELPEPLHAYILDVRPYVQTNIGALGDLDQHGDAVFSGVEANALAETARKLEHELAVTDWSTLPPLPRELDDQDEESGPATQEDVLGFLRELASAAERTGIAGRLVAYGD